MMLLHCLPSVPIDPASTIIKDLLKKMKLWVTGVCYQYRASLNFWGSVCIPYTSPFKTKFYEQVEDAAIGSSVSPIVASLYMEHFEGESTQVYLLPPRYWYRFVDDTWVIQQQAHKHLFLDHINSIDPNLNSQSKVIRKMELFHFLIPWSNQRQTIPLA